MWKLLKGQPWSLKKFLLCVCKIELRRFIWDLQSETLGLDGHLIIICFHVTLLTKKSMFSLSKSVSVMLWVTIFGSPILISKVIIQPVKANRSWIKRAQGRILFANSTNQSPGLTERLACALNANKNSIQANVSSFYARLCIQEVCMVVTLLCLHVHTLCQHWMSTLCQHWMQIKATFNSGKRFPFLRKLYS